MKTELFEIPLKARDADEQIPFLTNLTVLENNSLYVASAFDTELLHHVMPNKKGSEVKEIDSMKVPEVFGEDAVAVLGSLVANSSGDTSFVVLHRGSSPGFLSGLLGAKWPLLSAFELPKFLVENDGGMGFGCKHSVGQVAEGEIGARRFKEGGALVDVVQMGDYVLGLSGSQLWREGYLEQRIEKRIYVRKDLMANGQIHRDAADNFWFFGTKNRLHRMKIADIKAKPTFRTLEGPIWTHSEPCFVDGWLYGVDKDGLQLFRVRENPVSFEDELQKIHLFDRAVDSLCVVDVSSNPYLVISTSSEQGCEFFKMPVVKPEDPEFLPEIPKLESLGSITEATRVKDLTLRKISESQYQIFGLAYGAKAGQSGQLICLTF
ncbi:hypothetical protein GW915_08275 [bacterium]|nr:hypothetical protein [bacterium]